MGDGHYRLSFASPTGDLLVGSIESGVVATGIMSRLNHQGSYALVPSAYASDVSRLSRLTDSRRQACPGGDLLVIAEPVYVADLCDEQTCSKVSDPGHGHQQLNLGVINCYGRYLVLHHKDLFIEGLQDGELPFDDGIIHESEILLPQPRDPLLGPRIIGGSQSVFVKEAMYPILNHRPHFHEIQPVSQELPAVPYLLSRHVAGEEHVGSQQPGKDLGVDLVGLILRLSNQPGLPWVGQGDIDAKLLQYVVDLDPQVTRGLYDGLHVVAEGEKFQGELLYVLLLVQEADLVEQLSILVEDCCLAHLFMHVYSYILHGVSPWVVCRRHTSIRSLGTNQVAA